MPKFPFLPALALVCAGLAAPAAALDLGALTAAEREAFRAEVRSYLLENPELLLDVISVLEERQAVAQAQGEASLIAVNAEALFEDAQSWVGGNPDGDVTLVEFVDYNCGYCKRAFPEVTALIGKDGNIRFIVKELPILGPDSEAAARFAIAVLRTAGAEVYARAHDRLMRLQGRVSAAAVERVARELGLDMAAIAPAMESAEVSAVIEANRALAQRLGIQGTPSFVLEDRILRGYLPLDAMEMLVAEVRTDP